MCGLWSKPDFRSQHLRECPVSIWSLWCHTWLTQRKLLHQRGSSAKPSALMHERPWWDQHHEGEQEGSTERGRGDTSRRGERRSKDSAVTCTLFALQQWGDRLYIQHPDVKATGIDKKMVGKKSKLIELIHKPLKTAFDWMTSYECSQPLHCMLYAFPQLVLKSLLKLLLLSATSKGLLQDNILSNWDGLAPTLGLSNRHRCPVRSAAQCPSPLLGWELCSAIHSNRLYRPRNKDSSFIVPREYIENWKQSRIRQVRNTSFPALGLLLIPKRTS